MAETRERLALRDKEYLLNEIERMDTKIGNYLDTIRAIGLALGLPDPLAPDASKEPWQGNLSEKVATLRARAKRAESVVEAARDFTIATQFSDSITTEKMYDTLIGRLAAYDKDKE